MERKTVYTTILATVLLFMAVGCSGSGENHPDEVELDVPHGFQSVLRLELDGQVAQFGPFVGYYFRPDDPADLSKLRFVCYNENGFYASDMPVNALLYTGRARLVELPAERSDQPEPIGRITPVYFADAPTSWTDTRPEPQDQFVHFHSLHDGRGARMDGYWFAHEAAAPFVYDMGGRVGADSPLYHEVESGMDHDFARIVEFDQGSDGE